MHLLHYYGAFLGFLLLASRLVEFYSYAVTAVTPGLCASGKDK